MLMSPAKASHESPTGTGTDKSVAAGAVARVPVAEGGTKTVGKGSGRQPECRFTARDNISVLLRPGKRRPNIHYAIQAIVTKPYHDITGGIC
jgi:hypothetical protein